MEVSDRLNHAVKGVSNEMRGFFLSISSENASKDLKSLA